MPTRTWLDAPDLQLRKLAADYAAGRRDPERVLRAAMEAAGRFPHKHVWIDRLDEAAVLAQLEHAQRRRAAGAELPLFGIPFAVKDNIDVAGRSTTAACPSFAYVAARSARAVERSIDAGAILIGKTNLDQFATGLVGTRSPYGACSSAFDDAFISGGSSSGSALAVALGMVSFALGTDTAGSGRVPAGLNNLVGLKPTRGWVSTRGVVPACRSLDCVSVFAASVADAWVALKELVGEDPEEAYSRTAPHTPAEQGSALGSSFRYGVPHAAELEFFGDDASEELYRAALGELEACGGQRVEVDFEPFRQAAQLLYAGPWVAERTLAVGEHTQRDVPDLDPTVRSIIEGGRSRTAMDVFAALGQLETHKKRAATVFEQIDVLVLPTVPRNTRLAEVAQDPVASNSRLGYYTNFVNLLDLCGVAVPAGFSRDGLPFGVTLLGPAFSDAKVAAIAERLHLSHPSHAGATVHELDRRPTSNWTTSRKQPEPSASTRDPHSDRVELAVVGAHLRGQPLHAQLLELNAEFVAADVTAACYRLYALSGTTPPKPGLVRTSGDGRGIEIEVYALGAEAFGKFTRDVPAPLCIGNVELRGGRWVKGFLCEPLAIASARDITHHGGWKAFINSTSLETA